MKLGKGAVKHDARTLLFADYATKLPTPPASYSWDEKIKKWGMMLNDSIGDCTIATAGHLIMSWSASQNKLTVIPDSEVIKAYSAITGYNPKTGLNDNGAVELDVLNYWRKNGIGNHKILAFTALEPKNHDHIKQGVYLFGGCYIGVSLPLSAQTQRVWSVPPTGATGRGAAGSWGGHAINICGFDSNGLTVVTWGKLKRMTWAFLDAYCDESYCIISPDFVTDKTKAANGFDLTALQEDLKSISHK